MVGLTAYNLGRIIGALVLPAALLVWMIVWLRRGNRLWWIPLTLLIITGLAFTEQVLTNNDTSPPESSPGTPTLPSLDPASVFHAAGYRFVRLPKPDEERVLAPYATFARRVEVRVAMRAGDEAGRVLVIDPSTAEGGNRLLNFAAGLADSLHAPRELRTVEGADVYVVTPDSGAVAGYEFDVWLRGNLFVITIGPDPSRVSTLTAALIRSA